MDEQKRIKQRQAAKKWREANKEKFNAYHRNYYRKKKRKEKIKKVINKIKNFFKLTF